MQRYVNHMESNDANDYMKGDRKVLQRLISIHKCVNITNIKNLNKRQKCFRNKE